jgi:hypothetical protein
MRAGQVMYGQKHSNAHCDHCSDACTCSYLTRLLILAAGLPPCTMLSSAQAYQEWLSVLQWLSHVRAHAAAQPHVALPPHLEDSLSVSAVVLNNPLGSPHTTWKQLLDKKVSTHA